MTVPVVLAIVFGTRAEEWMTDVQHWLAAHKRPMTFYPSPILGVLVTLDALIALADLSRPQCVGRVPRRMAA